jgi:hypothetical protein
MNALKRKERKEGKKQDEVSNIISVVYSLSNDTFSVTKT